MHFHYSFIIEAMSAAIQLLSHLNAFLAGSAMMLIMITFKDDIEQKLFSGRRKCQPTDLYCKVSPSGVNSRRWEGCCAFYIDKLTKAVSADNELDYKDALYSLIDIGRAYDRELDPEGDPWELHDDSKRAKALEEKVINAIEEESDDEIIFDDEGRAHIRSDVMEATWD